MVQIRCLCYTRCTVPPETENIRPVLYLCELLRLAAGDENLSIFNAVEHKSHTF